MTGLLIEISLPDLCVDSIVQCFLFAIPRLFERLFLISWENNRDCHITMPLSLKTMEVQIKGDQ